LLFVFMTSVYIFIHRWLHSCVGLIIVVRLHLSATKSALYFPRYLVRSNSSKSHRPLTYIVLTTSIHIFIDIRLLSLLNVITIIILSFLWGQAASYLSFDDKRYGSSTCTLSTSCWCKWRIIVSVRLYPVHVKAYGVR
jgi:hypothetical protein